VPELSPWVLPGYAEERPLGRGASGRVVATVDEASGQRVAIKYLAPRLFRDPEFLAGFRAEADLLRSLDVPHVVRLFDYVEEPGQGAAIVMELVDGVSLHELISRRGATSPEAALVVLKGSLFGLAAAHALGIVHRDYKPENVLVDAEGNSKLSDFGVAVKEGRRAPAAGTPLYMAPEQWEGTAASPATDIYAAAAVFFECLTSKTPFSGRLGQLKQQHASAAIPLEEVDEPLRGLIARGMAKNPADRPANAMAFVTELESTAAAAYGPDWEERGRGQLKERAAALLLLLLGAGVGGGAGGAVAGTWFGARRNVVLAGTAAAAVVLAIAAAAAALSAQATPSQKPSEAMVTAMPPVVSSTCATPTTFTYSADLTAEAAGPVSYQWVYSTGQEGPVQTLHFTAPGTRLLSGGSVQAEKAGTGWAAIELAGPPGVLSNKAVYRLICATPGTVTASATVTPATRTVACGTAPPGSTFTGLIRSPKAGTVTYHWALSDGATSPPATLTFAGAGARAVQPWTVIPPADIANGAAVLVVTSPRTATSNTASYTLTCSSDVTPLALSAAAHAGPPAGSAGCTTAPSTVTFSGTITASKAVTVSYHWRLPSGNSAPLALTFSEAGTLPVTSVTYTPATEPASGSGTIVITSPMAATSTAAPFSLTCTKASIAVSLTSSPSSPDSVACASAPPTFTLTGSVTSDQPSSMTYHWVRSNGSVTGPVTVSLTAGSARAVTDEFTPPSDTFTGSDTLDITAPSQLSRLVPIELSCTYPPITITTSGDLPSGTAGTSYEGANVSATGGEAPYTWRASGLPPGLSMSTSGSISGTPAEAGEFTVDVTATDSQSPASTAFKQLTLVINPEG
jgi:tRNA A-37 threonylcarbamoyl transferase component Bud32